MKDTMGITPWDPLSTKRWDPFKEFGEIQNRLTSLFSRTNGGGDLATFEGSEFGEWAPAVDISEDDKEFTIVADIPQVKKKDVKISIDNGSMTISGERFHKGEEKKKKYHRIERGYGKYTRSFRLPEGIAEDKIDAKFDEGVLTVHLPKSEEAKHHGREIKVS